MAALRSYIGSLPRSKPVGKARWKPMMRALAGLAVFSALASAAPAQMPPQTFGTGEKVASAKPGDLRVFATGAIEAPFLKVRAQAERATRTPLVFETGSARGGLRDQIMSGTGFDVAVLSAEVIEELVKAGKLAPKVYEIGRMQISIGVRGDVPADLDVGSSEGIKRTLLGAKFVRFAPQGMGGPTARKIITDLGLDGRINEKQGPTDSVLNSGEYEVMINPTSEILSMRAVRNLGPVIPAFQIPVTIEAALSTSVGNKAAGRRLIAFFRGPAMSAALKASGYVLPKAH